MPDFSKMTVAKLKAELTSRGLSTDGLKKDLLARLTEFCTTTSTLAEEQTEVTPQAEETAAEEAPSVEVRVIACVPSTFMA